MSFLEPFFPIAKTERRNYLLGRALLYSLCLFVVLSFVSRIIFPTIPFSFNFNAPQSAKNTFLDPRNAGNQAPKPMVTSWAVKPLSVTLKVHSLFLLLVYHSPSPKTYREMLNLRPLSLVHIVHSSSRSTKYLSLHSNTLLCIEIRRVSIMLK